MTELEKLLIVHRLAQNIQDIIRIDFTGVRISHSKFTKLFGTDNTKINIDNWGGEDNMRYCTKTITIDGINICAIYEKTDPGYVVKDKIRDDDLFEAAKKLLENEVE